MLAWILAAGAVICLVYFIVLLVYSGIGTAYAFIWLLFAGGLGATAWCVRYYQKYPKRLPLRLPVSLVTLCGLGVVVMVLLQVLIIGKVPQVAEAGLEYVIVLGAAVKGEAPGKTLRLRLDKAAEYVLQNPETTLILSGGRPGDGQTVEAVAMQQYLLEKGVPDDRMLLETRSLSTVENIAYSRLLIEDMRNRKKEENLQDERALPVYLPSVMGPEHKRTHQIGILTSNFHLFRAMEIAKRQGMEDICGIASPSDRILFVHLCFRDGLAVLKERLAGNL